MSTTKARICDHEGGRKGEEEGGRGGGSEGGKGARGEILVVHNVNFASMYCGLTHS